MIRSVPPPELLLDEPFLPEDFPRRLQRVKETLGVSWDVLAACIGADPRQLQRWREGTKPCGDSTYALFLLADRMPGGVRLLLDGDGERRGRAPGGIAALYPEISGGPAGEPDGGDGRWV